jgi:hypothetical protein
MTYPENMSTTFALPLPTGFRFREAALTIGGICTECAGKRIFILDATVLHFGGASAVYDPRKLS